MAIDWEYQQHAEDRNEAELAAAIGGSATRGSVPVDVIVPRENRIAHGIELKTLVTQGNDKITMKSSAMARKIDWADQSGARLHTVVFDDRNVINGTGDRIVYYRPGIGSFRIGNMTRVPRGLQGLAEIFDIE